MNYAVITKAKAMYGKRLNATDVSMLTSFTTVEDCAAFLKAHPSYSRALEGQDIHGIHRGMLESALNSQYYIDFTRLTRGLSEKDKEAVLLLLSESEVETVLWALRSLGTDTLEKAEMFGQFSYVLNRYSDIDPDALLQAKTKAELTAAVGDRYGAVISRLDDYLSIETELWKQYYARLYAYIKKRLGNDDIRELLGVHTDLHNIITIYRLKEYFSYSESEIVPYMLGPAYKLREGMISMLCQSESAKEFAAVLKGTAYREIADAVTEGRLEDAADRYKVARACRVLHFSKSAPAVIYAYMEHKRSEINMIKTVVETVRYNLNREMIQGYVGTKAKNDQPDWAD